MPKITLTQEFVDFRAVCPDRKARIDYYDQKVVGVSLKVLASGHKAFYVRYRNDRGKLVERKLGSASTVKLMDARKIASDILAQVAVGEDPFQTKKTMKEVPTLAAFVAELRIPDQGCH